jgi:hypothetical protein
MYRAMPCRRFGKCTVSNINMRPRGTHIFIARLPRTFYGAIAGMVCIITTLRPCVVLIAGFSSPLQATHEARLFRNGVCIVRFSLAVPNWNQDKECSHCHRSYYQMLGRLSSRARRAFCKLRPRTFNPEPQIKNHAHSHCHDSRAQQISPSDSHHSRQYITEVNYR